MMKLITRLLETPAEKMLVARCYDMGEQRMRESCDFQIVQKSESENGVVLQLENKTFGLLFFAIHQKFLTGLLALPPFPHT